MNDLAQVRLDRWLWAARFFKTRSLAKTAIEGGKITVDGAKGKPAKEIHRGQTLTIRRGEDLITVIVEDLSDKRGPAKEAQTLYQETLESIETRELRRSERRMIRAGLTIPSNRPSKKQRRDLKRLKELAGEVANDDHEDEK